MPKRYILALIIITVIFFGGIFLLIRLLSGGGNGEQNDQNTSQTQRQKTLSENATSVTYTVYGKVVAEENRRAIRITITDSERKAEVLQGYDEAVLESQTLSNKSSAYESFMLALETAKFSTRDNAVKISDREICPLGSRFVYEAKYDDGSSFRSWRTTCENQASFRGNNSMVDTLFKAQIPEYAELTREVTL